MFLEQAFLGYQLRHVRVAKSHPVKTMYYPDDIFLVSRYEGIHAVAPWKRCLTSASRPYPKEHRLSSSLVAAEGRPKLAMTYERGFFSFAALCAVAPGPPAFLLAGRGRFSLSWRGFLGYNQH